MDDTEVGFVFAEEKPWDRFNHLSKGCRALLPDSKATVTGI